jgi:S-ribosylhomocysteine lyase
MEKITSFTIDHKKLNPGLYVSRIDRFGTEPVTTFDIRLKKPNTGDVLSTAAAHAIEHLGATFLRNDAEFKDRVVYFGPMGCRTGFYALLHGEYKPMDIAKLMQNMFRFIAEYEGEIPGASEVECGNYRDMDLKMAKQEAKHYYENTLMNLSSENTVYPSQMA